MSLCFQLFEKGQDTPINLTVVDERMCEAFGKEPDPVKWYERWVDTIGLGIALGKTQEQIKEFFPEKEEIIDWIFANFDTTCFRT